MTHEQARKLLGGYATNSLTEAERKALFEAALEDQELFDALQQEEALKELLADPASRHQIQQALAETPVLRSAPTRGRIWLWGGLAGAVAAAILIVAIMRPNQQPKYQVARVAPPQAPVEQAKPAIEAPPPAPLSVQQVRPAAPAPAKSRSPKLSASPVPSPSPAVTPQAPAFAQARATRAPSAMVTGSIADLKTSAPLRYVLVRRDLNGTYTAPLAGLPESGDAVRWTVFTAAAGYLSLYQLDASGDWKRLFPAAEPGLLMPANGAATIPDSPIIVTDKEQKFRLTLMPMDQAPLTIDLTVGPGKAP
jgi:hypothetical protein